MASIVLHAYKTRPIQVVRRLWRLALSREMSLTVLIAATTAVVLGATIPQRAWFSAPEYALWRAQRPFFADMVEALALNQVFTSWWFYTVVAMATVSLGAVNLRRALSFVTASDQLTIRAWRQAQSCVNGDSVAFSGTTKAATESVEAVLEERGYRVAAKASSLGRLLYAEKGLAGTWGSILFHLSFLLLLLGGLASLLTRFDGWMVITEGQRLTDSPRDYLTTRQGPLRGADGAGFQIRLDKFVPTYYRDRLGIDYTSVLTMRGGDGETRAGIVRVNHPLSYKGTSIMMESYGFAPLFTVKDREGRETLHSYVNLMGLRESGDSAEDMFKLPGTDTLVKVRIYPDLAEEKDTTYSASPLPRNPALLLEVDDLRNEPTGGLLRAGESMEAGDFTVGFSDLRYWVRFRVVKDPGEPVILTAFALGFLGIALRYLSLRKQVWVLTQSGEVGSLVELEAVSRPFDALFAREVNEIVAELKEEALDG